jgi:hypothetical protein
VAEVHEGEEGLAGLELAEPREIDDRLDRTARLGERVDAPLVRPEARELALPVDRLRVERVERRVDVAALGPLTLRRHGLERAQALERHRRGGDLPPDDRPLVDLPEPLEQDGLGAERRHRLAVPLDVAGLELVGPALPVEQAVDRLRRLQRGHLLQRRLRESPPR